MIIGCDIDGTLLDYNYIPGQFPQVNWKLVDTLRKRTDRITLISNQGGLPFGLIGTSRKDGRRYPTPQDFFNRCVYLIGALTVYHLEVNSIFVCTYHPKATVEANHQAALELESLFQSLFVPLSVSALPDWRKPSGLMLYAAGIDQYYGDSDEDEQAVANCDYVQFVKVERFFGGVEHG